MMLHEQWKLISYCPNSQFVPIKYRGIPVVPIPMQLSAVTQALKTTSPAPINRCCMLHCDTAVARPPTDTATPC